ncbi:PIN domain-containing protein [Candidatus Woesearchaeota archaeon]|jgi:predicted nucleic acid-binding protein|nr:PIN domain-containing protein [Candidatus Woesearchaeota archaeon]MBT6519147.1 PIN domain-containing protein [Candidatus Woesearchaeota archaeon]MBT7367802.1 PIN domain-containing protein [Candidatus Woesearchaeota archaeon]
MKELIETLEVVKRVDYMLDTCFLIYMIKKGKVKDLVKFCESNSVGMSSFNLAEIEHVHHKLDGTFNHRLRDFFKKKLISVVDVSVSPGDRNGEKDYVQSFDSKILGLVPDPSDAVLFVQALQTKANVLTRDRHHIFKAVAENYSKEYGVEVLNELPK